MGRDADDDERPLSSSYRWVAVAALCLAVVLFGIAFTVSQKRAAPPSDAGAESPAEQELFDFSGGGTQGWAFGDWQEGAQGAVAPAPPPARGLLVTSPGQGNGWFRAAFAEPVDLSGARTLSYDVEGPDGTDVIAALSVGPDASWCETKASRTPPGASTVTLGLESFLQGCNPELAQPNDLSEVRSVQIWFSEGTFLLSSVRVGG